MSKILNHVHSYERSIANKGIYRCIHPDCAHYQRVAYLIGKRAECSKCHDTFILTREQLVKMKVKLPVCLGCSNRKGSAEHRAAKRISEKMFTLSENTFKEINVEEFKKSLTTLDLSEEKEEERKER